MLPNIDKRVSAAPIGSHRAAANALEARVPGVKVEFEGVTGAPKFVRPASGFLTGPGGVGGAVRAETAAQLKPDDALRPLKGFLIEHRALFGHGPEVLDESRKTRDYVDTHNGLRTVVWQQQLNGVPVFHSLLKAHVTKRGELVNVGSAFVRDLAGASAAAKAAATKQAISAAQAIVAAAAESGDKVPTATVSAIAPAQGAEKKQAFRARNIFEPRVQQVWLPLKEQTLRLCWQVIHTSRSRGEGFLTLVDAETGEVLLRHGLTNYLTDATYSVFTSDSPSPFTPGHPTPQSGQPPIVPRSLETTAALNPVASPFGWIADGANETRGNNVDAHTDTNNDNAPDLPRPQGSPDRVFNPPLDLSAAPSTYKAAAVVNLFYWNNRIHDRFYELGFTPAAGNFQTNTNGEGGAGNDAVQADAQDGSGTDNANFYTPPDGQAPRMQMYIFSGPKPNRDGDFDQEIVIHEYTHGLSNRLVGGGSGISALQPSGMGEGWSDFYGLCLLAEAGDDVNGTYPVGGYASYQIGGPSFTTNYYFGIRRYPYSTNLSKNPLTFKDIDPDRASSHAGVPVSPIFAGIPAQEVHAMGEVWCSALWEVRAQLIAKAGGVIPGNDLVLQLVTDGMKLAPANPTYLQARDAILQADDVLTGGANRDPIWAGFAKRGMGFSASGPLDPDTTNGINEAFDLPDILKITPASGLISSGTVGGPFSPDSKTYTLKNESANSLTFTASNTQSWVTVTPSNGTLLPNATTTVTVSINADANALAIGDYADVVTFTNTTTGRIQLRPVLLKVSPPRVFFFSLDTDPGWARAGQWAFGQPTGNGGLDAGGPDPTSGATGANVFGVNLSGDYNVANAGPFRLTTAAVNFTGISTARLRFQRWLNTDFRPYAKATVEVSRNGTTWTLLYQNNNQSPVTESGWTAVEYDISAVADNQATVFVRWGYQTQGDVYSMSGWNIDDIELLGTTIGPIATNDNTTTAVETPVTINVLANDGGLNNPPHTVTINTPPATGTAVVNGNNTITYTPPDDFSGVASFTYKLTDSTAKSSTATVTIAVLKAGQTPVAADDGGATSEDTPVVIDVLANDSGLGDPPIALTVSDSENGYTVINPDRTITFVPTLNFSGAAGYSYRLTDADNQSATAVVSIAVSPVNDAPTFILGPDQGAAPGASPQTVPGFVSGVNPGAPDEAGQTVALSVVSVSDLSLFITPPFISPDGTLTYAPATDVSGTAKVTVQARDNGGTNDGGVDATEQSFAITIGGYTEAPGTYTGFVRAAAGTSPSFAKTGVIRARLNSGGSFSGKLFLGGKSFSFRGRTNPDGTATGLVLRGTSMVMDLQFQGRGTDTLTATITEGAAPFGTILAERAVNTGGLSAKYTAAFAGASPLSSAQNGQAVAIPPGHGIATLSVSSRGIVKVAGTMQDGSKFKYANAVSRRNVLPLFLLTDKKRGSVSGSVAFRDLPQTSDLDGAGLLWFKPAGRGRYPQGWPNGVQTNAVGSQYVATRGQTAFPDLSQPDLDGNAKIRAQGGGLPALVAAHMNIFSNNKVQIAGANAARLSAKIKTKTGMMSVKFDHPAQKKPASVNAVILQKQEVGFGFFLGPNDAGEAEIVKKP